MESPFLCCFCVPLTVLASGVLGRSQIPRKLKNYMVIIKKYLYQIHSRVAWCCLGNMLGLRSMLKRKLQVNRSPFAS
jgi:surface polysaccharide O-acyltransferase-like enzyme